MAMLAGYLRATDKNERARAPGRVMDRTRDGLLTRSSRTGQQQRRGHRGLTFDGIAQCPDRAAFAEQRALDAAARFVQERLRHAQLAFERRGPFRNPSLERCVGLLQRLRSEPSLLVQSSIVDRTRNLVGDDRHEVSLMLTERARHRTLN